jgi:sugar phosphate isomerase/epimerase
MRTLLAIVLCLALSMASAARACPGGIDATFIQLHDEQLRWGGAEWARAAEELRRLGISTVIVQYTGDEQGSFGERYGGRSIAHLLAAAGQRGIEVWVGLDEAPSWPRVAPPRFSPLSDERRAAELARLCASHASCAGFYLSPEIDDTTWSDRISQLRARVRRSVSVLRSHRPRARVSIAPFFTRRLGPAAYARFLVALLHGADIDVVMLQGGTGTGRASPADARMYYRALAPVLRARGVDTWLVVELFDQMSGTPWDERPFSARPATIDVVRRALLADERGLEHRVAFSVLDYMSGPDPRARRLRADYRAFCRRRADRAVPIAERASSR